MTMSKDPLGSKLGVENQSMEQGIQTKYVGITITNSGMSPQEPKAQVMKSNRMSGCMN